MHKSATAAEQDFLPDPNPFEILMEGFPRPPGMSRTALAATSHSRQAGSGKSRWASARSGRHRFALDRHFRLTPGFFPGLRADHDLMPRRRERKPPLVK